METLVKYEVRETIWPEKTFVTKRAKIHFDQLSDFFTKVYGSIYKAFGPTGELANEPPYAIYYSVNEAANEIDLAAAVPIVRFKNPIPGFEKEVVPRMKAVYLTYHGSYENMGDAYAALENYVKENGLLKEWVIEQYLSDPSKEKDPRNWRTNIFFLVK